MEEDEDSYEPHVDLQVHVPADPGKRVIACLQHLTVDAVISSDAGRR